MNYSCRSGNKKLLEDKNTIIIDNSYNINKIENSFIYELNELNTRFQNPKILNQQIIFKF